VAVTRCFAPGDRVRHPRGDGTDIAVLDHDWLGSTYQELDVRLDSGKCVRTEEDRVCAIVVVEEEE
jgi:hypothetical protein